MVQPRVGASWHCGARSRYRSGFSEPEKPSTTSSCSIPWCSPTAWFPGEAPAQLASQVPQRRRPERSEEHTSELQSRLHLVCRLLLEKKNKSCAVTMAADRLLVITTLPH